MEGQKIVTIQLRSNYLCGATLAGVRRLRTPVVHWPGRDFVFEKGDKLLFLKSVLNDSGGLLDESLEVKQENYSIGWRRLCDEQSKQQPNYRACALPTPQPQTSAKNEISNDLGQRLPKNEIGFAL